LIATLPEVAPMLRVAIAEYCRTAGFAPTIRLEAQLQQTIVSLVAENLGIALVPQSMRLLGIAGVTFHNLEAAPTIEQVAVWKPGNLNPTLWLFLQAAGIVRNSGVPPHGVAPITVAAIAVGREVGNLCYRSSLSECHRNLLHFIGFEPT
jgi:hypothetical protein